MPKAFRDVNRHGAKVLGARLEIQEPDRTIPGFHALAQVAHLKTSRKINTETLRIASMKLTRDINVLQIENVSERFHARHNALAGVIYILSRRGAPLRQLMSGGSKTSSI